MERRPLKPRTHVAALAAATALAGVAKGAPAQMPLFGRLKRKLASAMGRAKLAWDGSASIAENVRSGRLTLAQALQAAPNATDGTRRKWARIEYQRRTGQPCPLKVAQQLVPVVS